MARGKAAAAKSKVAALPVKKHAQHYFCSLCHHHHGRYTKIAAAHRQYRMEKKV